MAQPLRFTIEDGIAWLTLDRPEAQNAIDDGLRAALLAALARIASEPEIRAAVLTGAGGTFCPGADVWSGRRPAPGHPGRARRLAPHDSQRLIRALLALDKPIVAAVNGAATGLGAHLALACDLVVMAEEARFVAVFARRGIAIDSVGAYLLSRLVGLLKAKELVLLAEDVPAAEAMRIGLCNRVVPQAELAGTARAWAERLARGPTFALGLTKRLLERAYESDLDTALEAGTLAQSLVAQSHELPDDVRAAAGRRLPTFKGR